MPLLKSIAGLILIGGKSTRMGTSKHLMRVHGLPQYKHLEQIIESLNLDVYFSGRPDQVADLDPGSKVVFDPDDAIGPIGGILAGLEHIRSESVLVVACDLVKLTPATIEYLLEQNDPAFDVVTYQLEGQPFSETTCSIYHASVISKLKKAISKGEYSLQAVLKASRVKRLVPKNPKDLLNVNSPGDLP